MNGHAPTSVWSKITNLVLSLLSLLFALLVWHLSRHKFYAIDEFQYGHAAWLVHQGQRPYVDFFDHHFPLIYQLFSPLFGLSGKAAELMGLLRIVMLPVIALCLASMFALRKGRVTEALWGVLLCLSSAGLMTRMTEFRPDTLGFCFLLLALGPLFLETGPRWKGFWVGAMVTLAVWSTQKAMVYGLPFVLAFLLDAGRALFHKEGRLLGQPLFVVIGALAMLLTFPLKMVLEGGIEPWYRWCILWPMAHEQGAIGFPWHQFFMPIFVRDLFLVPPVLVGAWLLLREVWRERAWTTHPNILFLAIVPLTFVSFAMQKAAYAYSLIPFLLCFYMLAGVGLVGLAGFLHELGRAIQVGGFVLVTVLLAWRAVHFHLPTSETNHYQKYILSEVAQRVGPQDPVYDNSASTLVQPSIHYFYFTSLYIRTSEAQRLTREIPLAIEKRECTYVFLDSRFNDLSLTLRRWLYERFIPCQGELWVYGKQFGAEAGVQTFEAIRSGQYFIWPAETAGSLRLDGQPVEGQIIALERGSHQIENASGGRPYLIWLPYDGKVFEPQPRLPQRFSRI